MASDEEMAALSARVQARHDAKQWAIWRKREALEQATLDAIATLRALGYLVIEPEDES